MVKASSAAELGNAACDSNVAKIDSEVATRLQNRSVRTELSGLGHQQRIDGVVKRIEVNSCRIDRLREQKKLSNCGDGTANLLG